MNHTHLTAPTRHVDVDGPRLPRDQLHLVGETWR